MIRFWPAAVAVMSALSLWMSVSRAQAPLPPQPAKSPEVALAASLTPTLLGIGLVGAGLYVANLDETCTGDPSVPPYRYCEDHFDLGVGLTIAGGVLLAIGPPLGHLYNGRVWTTGLKVRLVGTGVGALGLVALLAAPSVCGDYVCSVQGLAALVMIGGGVTVIVGAGTDAATARLPARSSTAAQERPAADRDPHRRGRSREASLGRSYAEALSRDPASCREQDEDHE